MPATVRRQVGGNGATLTFATMKGLSIDNNAGGAPTRHTHAWDGLPRGTCTQAHKRAAIRGLPEIFTCPLPLGSASALTTKQGVIRTTTRRSRSYNPSRHPSTPPSTVRRRWGCETALQGARLRLARAYLAAGGDARGARRAARPTFDPGDADHFAAAASPVLRGLPAGQRG